MIKLRDPSSVEPKERRQGPMMTVGSRADGSVTARDLARDVLARTEGSA
ncbi:MAG: hypothetical protein AAGF11_56065 [Myxococcota bacterium]